MYILLLSWVLFADATHTHTHQHAQTYIHIHSHTYSTGVEKEKQEVKKEVKKEVKVKQEVKAKKSKGAAANSTGSRPKRVVNDIRYIAIIHLFDTILHSCLF